jgi:hypothetical protein
MEDDAVEIIKKTLAYYGLADSALIATVDDLWSRKQIVPGMDIDQIGVVLQDTDTFKRRFPANQILKDKGKPQFSVTEYLALEGDLDRVLKSRNMPSGFYDSPEDFQQMIANEVSPDELSSRIDQGYQAVRQASPQVVAEFQRLYGVSEGDLAAYFIDPQRARPTFDRYEAQRQAQAAAISAQAQTQAQITLQAQEAEALARAGITEDVAQAGFAQIGEQQGLFQAQMAGEQQVSQAEQIGATFGTNAQARQAIQRRRRRRQAEFEAGGGFAGQGGAQATGLTTVGE